ncbi:MAG: DUF4962 domain-containing protein [Candidatus Zixiibacteriota bacterium]|nr:MAG: DUF4962 domain-containing protein [candidate division Zixibacteria bacterium]
MSKVSIASLVVLACLLLASSAAATSSLPPPPNVRITYYPELNNEEQVFICPGDSNIVIANWRDFRLGYRQIGIGRSTDGGLTWVDSLIPVSMQYFGADARQSDPTMTVDGLGNYYMSVLDYDAVGENDGSVISFYKSVDKGVSWSGPVPNVSVIIDPEIFEDKQFITVDRTGGLYDGNLYCSWTRFPNPDRIMLVRSIDGCESFEDTVTVGPSQSSTGCGTTVFDAGQFSIPIVTSNGDLHVFWQGYSLDSGAECSATLCIKHRVSDDGGLSFGPEQAVLPVSGYTYANGGIDTYSQPVGDADLTGGPFDGNLYIAFTNRAAEDSIDHTDVDFIRSTDNGATWSDRYQINDAPDADNMDAFHPWLIVNQEGILAVIFYDQRYDPTKYSRFDCIAAYSFDGGETFTTNHRVSSESSRPQDLALDIASLPVPSFKGASGASTLSSSSSMAGLIAEYIGVTAFYDKILAVWTDTRDDNQEVYSATWDLPLLEPRLAYPEDLSSHESPPLLGWSTSWKNNIDRYRVELSESGDFSSGVISDVVDTNFYQPSSALGTGTWYWRVKTFDVPTNDSSGYSNVRRFTSSSAVICGDADGNGQPDILDVDYMIDWLYRGGPAPVSMEAADVDNNDQVDILDIDYFIDWLFREGPDLNCG